MKINALHRLAIRYGWYKMVTTGLPLNVGRTIFGVYFFEGDYAPLEAPDLFRMLYNWGIEDAMLRD